MNSAGSVQQDFNQDIISESSQEESDDDSNESEDDFDKKYVSKEKDPNEKLAKNGANKNQSKRNKSANRVS